MLKIEEHEKHIQDLTELLKVEGVDLAKVSTIVQALRENYTEVNTTLTDNTQKILTFTDMNENLRSANMSLLSKIGSQLADLGNRQTHQENNKQDNKGEGEKSLSLDDIAKEFLK